MVYVAIMGYGVVGSGVSEVLLCNAESIRKKAGDEIRVRRILDLREFPEDPLHDLFTKDFEEILADAEIRIVVETMGGLHPAYEYVKRCLECGKSVVTSNKELVAAKGDELLAIAKEKNLNFLFEASVGGGIPILRPLDQCLAANEVYEVDGILNGTTNFMLSRMIEENESFDDALALAQKLGYAERNPAADVSGADACRKTCILASLAFGKHVHPEEIHTEGIETVALTDVRYAAAAGYAVKLIGSVRKTSDGHVLGLVAPMLVHRDCLLSNVTGVFNAIMVRGNAIGDVMFYGRGAGKLPTASAVVADVIDEVKHFNARKYLFWQPGTPGYVQDYRTWKCEHFLRFVCTSPTEKDMVNTTFSAARPVTFEGMPANEVALITRRLGEDELQMKLAAVRGAQLLCRLRVADI